VGEDPEGQVSKGKTHERWYKWGFSKVLVKEREGTNDWHVRGR